MAEAFTWGAGGAKLTPEQLALARAVLARKKSQGVDTSPVGHWTAGAARVADAIGDVFQERRLNSQQAENDQYNAAQTEPLIAAISGANTAPSMVPPVIAPAAGGETAQAVPAVDISGDKQTFIQSLLPAAIEEGARTGVDPRIIVAQAAQETGWGKSAPGNNYFGIKSHGQSGGQTLATNEVIDGKTVRINDSFRQFASPADSVRGYGEFITQNPRYKPMREAQGIDAQLQALQASGYATDPNYSRSVGAIARSIPLPETPQAAIQQAAPSGYVDPAVSVQQTALAPPISAPVEVAARPVASAPMEAPPQAPQQSAPPPAVLAQALRVMADPRANENTKAVAQALIQRQQAQEQAQQEQSVWQQRQAYEQQQQANDPLRQLQIQKAQQDIAGGKRQSLVNAGDGRLYDPNAGTWITAPDASNRNFRQATPDEVKAFGTNGQVGPDGKFYPITPPQGTALSVDPNTGAVTFNQGAGVKPLTEGQSKDSFFTTRMTASLPSLEANEQALLSLGGKLGEAVPMNLGNYAQSEEYQLARDAGRDFVTAYLRKDSGAALTPSEEKIYGELLLPQPGDKPATIALKRQRRQVAVEAIKSGMPPQALDGVIKAINSVPGADRAMKPTVIDGYQIEEITE